MPIVRSVRNVDRMRYITEVAVKHGFGYIFERNRLRDLWPRGKKAHKPGTRGVHIREMLEELGPTFIKFGQLLSTRPDLVPADIILELRKLQDEVREFPVEQAFETIESELGLSMEQLFLEFDERPIAAASIGQVHRAVLPGGDEVIVKVQRPDAEKQIEADIDLLYQLAHLLAEHTRHEFFVDPVGVVDQFTRGIRNELDYRIEARNADHIGKNFRYSKAVVIPKVYWQYSTSRVLTLEYIDGTQVVDMDLESMDFFQRKQVATIIAQCWFEQIFVHGFFHGDPHPANILVIDSDTIALVDFGIAGRLGDKERQNIINLFLDVMNERIERLPRRLAALGVEFPREKEVEFVAETRDVFAKYFGVTLDQLDPVTVFRDIFGAIYRLKLKLPTQYLLLDRAVATLEGIGNQVCPTFNVFEVVEPYVREFMRKRYSPETLAARGSEELQNLAGMLVDFPYQVHEALEQVRKGEVSVNFVHRNLEDVMRRMTVMTNRLVVAIVLAAVILGSSVIGLFATQGPQLWGVSVFALIGYMASAFFGLWLVVGIFRSGRL
jgi:ubiquinone biosynthesis protein